MTALRKNADKPTRAKGRGKAETVATPDNAPRGAVGRKAKGKVEEPPTMEGAARKRKPRTGRKPEGQLAAIGLHVNEGPGRPTDYRPEYARTAKAMCKLGATDSELAEEFGVNTSTIWYWRSKHEEFSNALNEGKDAFDNRAERSLAMKAVGYSYHSEKVFCFEGAIIRAPIIEHCPPDTGAIKLWLSNRRPEQWRDKQEVKLDGSDAFLNMWSAISDGAFNRG
jgi:hypothetical protein